MNYLFRNYFSCNFSHLSHILTGKAVSFVDADSSGPIERFLWRLETRYGIPDFIVKASSQLCSVRTPQQTNQTTPYIVTGAQLS